MKGIYPRYRPLEGDGPYHGGWIRDFIDLGRCREAEAELKRLDCAFDLYLSTAGLSVLQRTIES